MLHPSHWLQMLPMSPLFVHKDGLHKRVSLDESTQIYADSGKKINQRSLIFEPHVLGRRLPVS